MRLGRCCLSLRDRIILHRCDPGFLLYDFFRLVAGCLGLGLALYGDLPLVGIHGELRILGCWIGRDFCLDIFGDGFISGFAMARGQDSSDGQQT
jgi:hypothetical protein